MADETIFIVEDDSVFAEMIRTILIGYGYHVPPPAPSGEEAIRSVAEICPDLVLMDIQLEGEMDGIQAAAKIQEKITVPIIYLTAYPLLDRLKHALSTEPYGYLAKPIEGWKLKATLETALYKSRMDRKLKQSELQFRQLAESIREVFWLQDVEKGEFLYISPAFEEISGRTVRSLGADVKSYLDLVHPDDREKICSAWVSMVKEQTPINAEFRIVRPDGAVRWVCMRSFLICDDTGKQNRWSGIMEDITDRIMVQQEVERRVREQAALYKTAHMMTSTLDVREVLNLAMREAQTLLRADAASVLLLDEARQELFFAAAAGEASEKLYGTRIPAGAGFAGWALKNAQPLLVRDAHTDSRFFQAVDARTSFTTRSLIVVPMECKGKVIGVMEVLHQAAGGFDEQDLELLTTLANSATIAIENAQLFEELNAGRERLKQLSRRLVAVQETERHHIALELHDEIGQELTGIKLLLGRSIKEPPEKSRQIITEVHLLVNELLGKVRELSLELRPSMLDDLGLLPALEWHFQRYTAQTQIQIKFRQVGLDRRFQSELEIAVYRILQEALTNIARHAQVDQVSVDIWSTERHLTLRVEDKGVGFDHRNIFANGVSSGLYGMRERATLLDGSFTLVSIPGQGTRISVKFPLENNHELIESTR